MGQESQNKVGELTSQDLGSELMLYDAYQDKVHILNETAKAVWEGMAAGRTEGEIALELRRRFSAWPERDVLADVRAIIAELRERGLLKTPQAM